MPMRNLFRNGRFFLALALALGIWLLMQPHAVRADEIVVTSTLDSGAGTLRQAIADAASGDTIVFSDSMSIYLDSELSITKSLTVDGGVYTVTVSGDSGNNGSRNVRAFNISAGSVVTLAHLTIIDCDSGEGAGIYNAGDLTVIGCNISNNNASSSGGGAIRNFEGILTVRDSVLANNSGTVGGAILGRHGSVVLQNSTLSGNSASTGGGAVYYDDVQYAWDVGSLTVLSSTFAHNSSWYGGGIRAEYVNLVVQHSVFAYNTAQYGGGGIYFYADSSYPRPITVDNSTFVGNVGGTVSSSGINGGGGIYNRQGEMTIRNSTFSGNSAPESEGGAIVTDGTLNLLNSTLIGNSSRNEFNASGLANWGTSLHIKNTLIASDSPNPDCRNSGIIETNINNLVEDGSCNATFSGDPLLGPLADNGGPRVGAAQDTPLQTHALLLGSPALDAGDGGTCLTTDQRGAPRPQGVGCDIGALEMFRLVVSKSVTPTVNVPYHGVVTYTLTLSNTSPVSDTTVLLTDTLPAAVDFGDWVANHGATVSLDDTLTWSGVVTAGAQMALTFTATHTGDYNETVVNTATFSSGAQWWASGADTAAFTTECTPARSVQNGHDSGPGSLRAAIAEVCSGGLIMFNDDVSITLSSELLLDKALTIDGHGRAVTLSGNDTVRVFNIASGSSVTLSHLSIVSGTATDGGGIYNAGNLIVQAGTLADNAASVNGGGIRNAGTLLVQNSTLSGNTAPYGGGINSTGNATLHNSTLSGNTGNAGAGGGIRQWGGRITSL